MTDQKKQGKRKEKRVPFKEYVLINGALRAKAIDISEGGIYVHTGRSFKPGATVYVNFILKYVEFDVRAKVQFAHEGVGMGLMFRALPDDKKAKIREYVEDMSAHAGERSEEKPRAVIIYDNSPLKMHKSELVLAGYSVFDVENKPGIFSRLIEIVPIDIIVLASEMARTEDFKLLSMLMESPDFNHIPVVVISGNCQPEVSYKVMVYGAREFLPKLVTSPRKLVDSVNEILEQK